MNKFDEKHVLSDSPTIDEINSLLNKTGWQSWSDTGSTFPFKLPRYDFPPANYIPEIDEMPDTNLKPQVTGWCSWPQYGLDVNETVIKNQILWLKNNPNIKLDYILLDDGWAKWGDWFSVDTKKFPNGLKRLVEEIKASNMRAGVWIAPFLVYTDSNLVSAHPDWLVKKNGDFVDGLNLTGISLSPVKRYLLDVSNVDVQDYLLKTFDWLFNEVGFELVKLDFLYGAYLNPSFTSKSSDKFLHKFLKNIKEKYPNVYTIGCGCPLAPALGVVDSMRIAKDNSIACSIPNALNFCSPFINKFYAKNYIPSLQRNYAQRFWTNKFWNLDLDTFICDEKHGFTESDLNEMMKMIIDSKGNIFLGDDLTILDHGKLEKYILPVLQRNLNK